MKITGELCMMGNHYCAENGCQIYAKPSYDFQKEKEWLFEEMNKVEVGKIKKSHKPNKGFKLGSYRSKNYKK